MPADVLRLFVFARHAESAANAADVLNTNPSQPVALTERRRAPSARCLAARCNLASHKLPMRRICDGGGR
jgi:hypothetical protein